MNHPITNTIESSIERKISPRFKCWRLIYDDNNVLELSELDGVTETIWNLECWDTEEECVERILQLGLIWSTDITNLLQV